jgi:hypothetical protein
MELQMRRIALPLIALLLFGVSACGDEDLKQPPVSAFADGTCRVAAPDVLALGKAGAHLGKGKTIDAAAKAELKDAQDGLRTVAEGAEPAYKKAFQNLIVSTGFVRIRADGNTYDASLGRQMMADYNAVVRICTARA